MNVEVSPQVASDVARRVGVHAALSDPVRLRVVDALALGDASPSDLRRILGVSSNLLAHHLGVLERQGLVQRRRSQADHRRSYLRLMPESLDGLVPSPVLDLEGAERVVFVCTANSARSQLAAALWARTSDVPVASAGTHPADRIAPGAVAAAGRRHLRLAKQNPRRLQDVTRASDYLITVCDNAHEALADDGQLPGARRLHWSVPDPVAEGTQEAFDAALADLEQRVVTLSHHLTAS